jgi:FkbM family methyltransferase
MTGDEYKLMVQGNVSMFLHISQLKKRGFIPTYILDIGAFEGEWTKEISTLFPSAHIVMFEAQPSKKEILEKVSEQYPHTEYCISLLGNEKRQQVSFYEFGTGSSIYEENKPAFKPEFHLDMEVFDTVMQERVKTKPTSSDIIFAKLDVQGAELDVLKGMHHIVPQIEVVLLEVSLTEYNKGAPQFAEIVSYMDSIGFCVYDFCEEKRTDMLQLFQFDMFFVKKESRLRI